VLRVHVMSGSHSGEVASRLSAHDSAGRLAVTVADLPGTVAIVVGIDTGGSDVRAADVVLDFGPALAAQIDRLWSERLAPFARCMAGLPLPKPGPPVLRQHDPQLPAAAERMLRRVRAGLTEGGFDDGRWTYDHIGSTAVSPGVFRDGVKDPGLAPAEAYRKRLYFRPDPAQPSILHLRQLGSPWWSYTVQFRDWLRANPAGRSAYERAKQQAADAHANDADFDDYTRAKAAFFDQVQGEYEPGLTRSPPRGWMRQPCDPR
jgi:GrpB-like predicted nucleotidyltransferase (UPF0157 family)